MLTLSGGYQRGHLDCEKSCSINYEVFPGGPVYSELKIQVTGLILVKHARKRNPSLQHG